MEPKSPMKTSPLPLPAVRLASAIAERRACIGIVGLGYAGLPLVEVFVNAGFPVVGFDIDRERVGHLRRGESYLGHLTAERVQQWRATGRFDPTGDFKRLSETDVSIVCVPTPLLATREPDLSHVRSAVQAIADRLRSGQMVILESTSYPGTTREVVLPILEAGEFRVGRDFFLAYSPEREDPGNLRHSVANIPKVVGAMEQTSGRLAVALYGAARIEVVPVSSMEVAEACKMLENSYRAVNIALVNELKMVYDRMGIDIWEVIEAAKTKPFGFQAFYPGPGLGGHCIPIDPFYLAWSARRHDCPARFLELAGEINTAMPAYVAGKVFDALAERGKPLPGSKVCLLGLAYKKDIDDSRQSPALALLDLLRLKGAQVTYNDPHIPRLSDHHGGPALDSQPLTEAFLQQQDCVLIVTDHSAYDWKWIVANAALVVDTRNATQQVKEHRERIVNA